MSISGTERNLPLASISSPSLSILIIGCGDVGCRVAALLSASESVYGVVRSQQAAGRVATHGGIPLWADLDDPKTLHALPAARLLFYFAPPPADGDTDPRLDAVLAALNGKLPLRVVYISTTAVYGDCRGDWITEQQAVEPTTARGRRRWYAERALTSWCLAHEVALVILRVAGIYGPGRVPHERLARGLPVLHEAIAPYTNRIHQDDLARVCVAAAERAPLGALYNVADGHPSTMTRYFLRLSETLGYPAPPQVSWEQAQAQLSVSMLSFLADSRRIDNTKLLRELNMTLKYPDLEAGLATLVAG